jgi:hypothetical protein
LARRTGLITACARPKAEVSVEHKSLILCIKSTLRRIMLRF